MTVQALSRLDVDTGLAALPGWSYDEVRNAIYRRIEFADFGAALGAMLRIAFVAEAQQHHPEWSNVYNVLDIWLTTHDAAGVSVRDLQLAHAIDTIAN